MVPSDWVGGASFQKQNQDVSCDRPKLRDRDWGGVVGCDLEVGNSRFDCGRAGHANLDLRPCLERDSDDGGGPGGGGGFCETDHDGGSTCRVVGWGGQCMPDAHITIWLEVEEADQGTDAILLCRLKECFHLGSVLLPQVRECGLAHGGGFHVLIIDGLVALPSFWAEIRTFPPFTGGARKYDAASDSVGESSASTATSGEVVPAGGLAAAASVPPPGVTPAVTETSRVAGSAEVVVTGEGVTIVIILLSESK